MADSALPFEYGPFPHQLVDHSRSLAAYISTGAVIEGDPPWLQLEEEQWSWPVITQAVTGLATYWASDVKAGDRVAISIAHSVEHMICELAAWHLAASVELLDVRQSARERDSQLASLQPQVVVGDPPPIGPWLATPLAAVRTVSARAKAAAHENTDGSAVQR